MLWARKDRLVGPIYFNGDFSFSFPLTLLFQMLVSLNMDSLPGEWLGYLDNHLLNSFFFFLSYYDFWNLAKNNATGKQQTEGKSKQCWVTLVNYRLLDAGGIPQLPRLAESF